MIKENKKMKKFTKGLLALLAFVSVVGCGGSTSKDINSIFKYV